MINPSRLSELGKALSRRFFAGEAVLVLSKIKKRLPLSEHDTYFLKEINNFFEKATAALDMTYTELVASEVFVQNTLVLYELAIAISRWNPRANFRRTMDHLASVAAYLFPLQPINAQDLEFLINIFMHLDRYYAERTADLLE